MIYKLLPFSFYFPFSYFLRSSVIISCIAGVSNFSHAQFSTLWAQNSNPSSSQDYAYAVAIDNSGIYVVGKGGNNMRIEKRDKTTGLLIPSFGTAGAVTESFSIQGDYLSIAVDPSGIYAVGNVVGSDWYMVKHDLNTGALIWTQTSNPSSGSDIPYAIAIDGSGIYVVGSDSMPGNDQWHIEKRDLITGALIWSQSNNPSAGIDFVRSVTVNANGLYVMGHDYSTGRLQWRIEKRNLNTGSLIPLFGNSGVDTCCQYTTSPTGMIPYFYRNDITTDGNAIYAVGWKDKNIPMGYEQWHIEKRDLNTGTLITSFGTGGMLDGVYTGAVSAIDVDPSGIYIVGCDGIPGHYQWHLEKCQLSSGELICSATSNPSVNLGDMAYDFAIDATGIYVVGFISTLSNDWNWRIVKYDLCTSVGDELNYDIDPLIVFPDPTSGIFYIETGQAIYKLVIYDILGIALYQSQISAFKTMINISSQPPGIYFLQFQTSEGVVNKKIVLSR